MKQFISIVVILLSIFSVQKTNAQFLTIKFALQGYTPGPSLGMTPAISNWGMWNSNAGLVDFVDISLLDGNDPSQVLFTGTALVDYHKICTLEFPDNLIGASVYISVKSRSHVTTASSYCIKLPECHSSGRFGTPNIDYDFTTAASQAFASNQVEAPPGSGQYAFYAGDINQDCAVDALDYLLWDAAANAFGYGCAYAAEDLNGDGNVDLLDYSVLEANINGGAGCILPTADHPCNADGYPKMALATNTGDVKVLQQTDRITVEYLTSAKGQSAVSILDINGKIVKTFDIDTEAGRFSKTIHTTDLTPGIYIIKVLSEGKMYTNKFIKQ